MIIEIHGAGFQNKGAELMLRTVVNELRHRLPKFVPTIDPSYGSYESRAELGLRQMIPTRFHVSKADFTKRFLRQKLFAASNIEKFAAKIGGIPLSNYGCTSLNQTEALIDIAGFAYTDEWGYRPTQHFAQLTDYYSSKNRPVILLPQAFGPFQSDEIKTAFKKVINNASIIFPRDKISYQNVMELASDSSKVLQVPDITLFYSASKKIKLDSNSNYACLVPNCRMLDQGKDKWGDKYESYLIKIAEEIMSHGVQVRILVHDTSGQDLSLAKKLASRLTSPNVVIVNEPNPVELKRIVGESLILIGSRYHSLVASFSQKVPALALGWSHKYEMLFQEFKQERFLISDQTSLDTVLTLTRELINKEKNMQLRQIIFEELQKMQIENEKMWEIVVNLLKKK